MRLWMIIIKKQIIKYGKEMSMDEKDKKQIEGLSANEQFIDYILEKLLNEFNKLTRKMQIIIILFVIENIVVSIIFVTLYILISGG